MPSPQATLDWTMVPEDPKSTEKNGASAKATQEAEEEALVLNGRRTSRQRVLVLHDESAVGVKPSAASTEASAEEKAPPGEQQERRPYESAPRASAEGPCLRKPAALKTQN